VICYLDTQVMVWLCQKQLQKFTPAATAAIEESDLRISPIVLLELEYLFEIKHLIKPPQVLRQQLASQIGLDVCTLAFPDVVEAALYETWTRDPFDRLIVAHAKTNACAPLITSDKKIRKHYTGSVW